MVLVCFKILWLFDIIEDKIDRKLAEVVIIFKTDSSLHLFSFVVLLVHWSFDSYCHIFDDPIEFCVQNYSDADHIDSLLPHPNALQTSYL